MRGLQEGFKGRTGRWKVWKVMRAYTTYGTPSRHTHCRCLRRKEETEKIFEAIVTDNFVNLRDPNT